MNKPQVILALALLIVPSLSWGEVFEEKRAEVEPAVERALSYLERQVRPDGTYPGGHGGSTGIVSIVGMTFLSAGYTPNDPEYGKSVIACIDFVLDHHREDGLLDSGEGGNGPMYAHVISTLFLSEVSGMVGPDRQARIAEVLPSALQLILDSQALMKEERYAGGWRYRPDSLDSDLSCSGWALMALRSSRLNGAPVPDRAFRAATQYITRNFSEENGRFGYQNKTSHHETLTGAGVLCLVLTGTPPDDPGLVRAGDSILKVARGGQLINQSHALYGNYYNSQGMFQLGGKHWESYYQWMTQTYLPQQKDDGSWDSGLGEVYGTAMMTMALTVPYRCLPIYQRDETVDK
ncbi:hypothetical protein OAF27_01205 [Verrucomicrobiales bacterium]|nr:hypothetical protein [Verrucomicrobiales bacterium]